MLSKIIVKKLFNLYDYTIDLTNADGTKVKFVTAPNGYGKTTLLDFIYDVMTGGHHRLFEIPFSELSLMFDSEEDPHLTNCINVIKSIRVTNVDKLSDEVGDTVIELAYSLKEIKNDEKKLIEQFTILKNPDGTIGMEGNRDNTDMFFVARTCHYITDNRLMNIKTDYHEETLFIHSLAVKNYAEDLKNILKNPELKKAYASRIDVFKKVIDRCEFANKHIEIDERFGFRFVSHDELETKLLPDNLSSGEKHMIIQSYEILFKAKSGSLIMIDEPELSLHMMWQINYLKNLQNMMDERNFQCIVATHSPQIFNSLWSKSVDLFTISSQN